MRVILALLACFYCQAALAANPTIKTSWKFYNIKGETSKQLKAQMKRKGPKGFWAYAKWNVKWTSNCRVTVSLKYTFPKWKNKADGSGTLQKNWIRMTSALKKHEKNHGSHGIMAGREIAAANCKKGNAIIKKWAKQDKTYDRKTNHGEKEGVVLP